MSLTLEFGIVKEKIQTELKAAMKSGDKLRMMALRGVLSEISRLEKDVRRDANDAEIVQIFKRERAKREEALEFARKAARQDLIDQNETEAKILESYIPAATSTDEVRAEIQIAISAGASQIGPIMKALRDKFGPNLDSKAASELTKEALAKK
ncbi:MAG: transamidase GatB domain protein [Candidatus Binatus sp.]|nr:transamidase GatB domain protein [Candidatus Binatus sp.]